MGDHLKRVPPNLSGGVGLGIDRLHEGVPIRPELGRTLVGHIESLPEAQLFNLRTDPAESKNLAAEHPEVVKLITKLANEARTELGDFNGPGSGVRFFETGARWPQSVIGSKAEHPGKRKQAK